MCYISIGLKNAAAFSLAATLDALRSGVFYFVPLRPYRRRRAGCSPSLAPKGRKNPVRRRKLSSTKRERGPTPAHLKLRNDNFYLEKMAREELNLVRPGEIIYRFPPTEPKKNRSGSVTGDPAESRPSTAQKQPR